MVKVLIYMLGRSATGNRNGLPGVVSGYMQRKNEAAEEYQAMQGARKGYRHRRGSLPGLSRRRREEGSCETRWLLVCDACALPTRPSPWSSSGRLCRSRASAQESLMSERRPHLPQTRCFLSAFTAAALASPSNPSHELTRPCPHYPRSLLRTNGAKPSLMSELLDVTVSSSAPQKLPVQ